MNDNLNINMNGAIETLMAQTMAKISQTASTPECDVVKLEALTKRASELKQMKEQIAAITYRLVALNGIDGSEEIKDLRLRRDGFRRELWIEVSQGMVNQNLFTL